MADLHIAAIPAPQQPGLLSYIVFGEIPDGYCAVEVTDDNVSPHLRKGDFAIIDDEDCEPSHGEIFLVEWGGRQQLVECGRFPHPENLRPRGEIDVRGYWNLYAQNAEMQLVGGGVAMHRCYDGPYGGTHLRDKLLGRVVGIYQPDFARQVGWAL